MLQLYCQSLGSILLLVLQFIVTTGGLIIALITQHKCDTMCKTNIGSTPLHNAAQKGHLDVVEYLITQHKCDTMCKDNQGSTPLHNAAQEGHLDVVEYLITQHKCDTMCKDNQGSTPLHNAAHNGHLDVVSVPDNSA